MVRVISQGELFEMDVEGEPVTEGFWLRSLDDAYELFRANYIDLRTLDRIKDAYYNVMYNHPKGTRQAISLLRHQDGHWIIYQRLLGVFE